MQTDHHMDRMRTTVLAIDPGPFESAFVIVDDHNCKPVEFGKIPNQDLLYKIDGWPSQVAAVEMVASYGMAVGAEVFETCVWIGRFYEAIQRKQMLGPLLVKRKPIKLHHCGSTAAKDSNITQALVDRFAPGQPNRGKGTKKQPGWFHGFRADVWQAYALAVYVADTTRPNLDPTDTSPHGEAAAPHPPSPGAAPARTPDPMLVRAGPNHI
jgi:hypothetical protein